MSNLIKDSLDVKEHLTVRGAGLSEFFGPAAFYSYVWFGIQATDFDTSDWGVDDKGRMWFNSTENTFKYWDGSSIQLLGAGSGVSPDTRNDTILQTLGGVVAWGRRITYDAVAPTMPISGDIWLEPTT